MTKKCCGFGYSAGGRQEWEVGVTPCGDPGCARALASSRGDLTVKDLARSGDFARTEDPHSLLGVFSCPWISETHENGRG